MTTTGRSTKAPSTKSATGARRAGPKSPATRESGEVAQAVERDLAKMPADFAQSGLAMMALALAREVDAPTNSATSKSMCASQLRETLDRLRELTPPAEEADELDDLARRRESRRAGASAPTG